MLYSTPAPSDKSCECIIYAERNDATNILTTPVHAIQLLYMRFQTNIRAACGLHVAGLAKEL
jgi:hypothetical protein